MVTKRAAIALLAATLLAAGGCGRDSGEASASPTSTPAAQQLWDPCTIPDDAVRAAGLRTETKSNDYVGGDLPDGWKICKWESAKGWYRLTVFSTPKSMDEVKNNPKNRDVKPVDIAGKQGIQYRGTYDMTGCDVAAAYGNRTIITAALDHVVEGAKGDTCVEALAVARQFQKYHR